MHKTGSYELIKKKERNGMIISGEIYSLFHEISIAISVQDDRLLNYFSVYVQDAPFALPDWFI